MLRDYPYCQTHIRQHGLHDKIHNKIPSIPAPTENECAFILENLRWLSKNHRISDHDSTLERLSTIINILNEGHIAKRTMATLIVQKTEIIEYKFKKAVTN